MFSLACFGALWDICNLVSPNIPQCALGSRVGGDPTYKNTTVLASSILSLLKQFEAVRCIHQRHGTLMGRWRSISKTKLAQVWPREMCQRMCNDMQPLLRRNRRFIHLHGSDSYPNGFVGECLRGRPRKCPEGVISEKHCAIYDCPACVAFMRKLHPSHTRNGAPPLLCRYYQHEFGKGHATHV